MAVDVAARVILGDARPEEFPLRLGALPEELPLRVGGGLEALLVLDAVDVATDDPFTGDPFTGDSSGESEIRTVR